MTLSGTITPWLLGGLVVLVLLTVGITLKAWRDAKSSPYFFLRRQALQRMQSYALASFCLIVVTFVTAVYTWQTPPDTTARTALITYAKPNLEINSAETELSSDRDQSPTVVQVNLTEASESERPLTSPDLVGSLLQGPQGPPALPTEFKTIEPRVSLKEDTELGSIAFSTVIDNNYEAIQPNRRFGEGFFTLYATFRYDAMVDGMSWAWVWRHNGTVVGGNNELWTYGNDGPGYVYFKPEEGFQPGEYSLEVWVNNELLTQANVIIAEGISAGN